MAEEITTWIERYRRAWESNEPEDILALFTENASYRTEPFAAPWSGRQEIVAGWLADRDEPGATDFEWHLLGKDGRLHFVEGVTAYRDGPTYRNLWVIRLGPDGRAEEFTEWWMEQEGD